MAESLMPFEAQREALAERLKLKEQYESQVKILNKLGILEILPDSQELGIVGIDQKQYPLPSYEEVLHQITAERAELLDEKIDQGFDKLLLIPFALPQSVLMSRYISYLEERDRTGQKYTSTDGHELSLSADHPIKIFKDRVNYSLPNYDETPEMTYFPTRFIGEQEFDKRPDQGFTKSDLIGRGVAWRPILVESNVPEYYEDDLESLKERKPRRNLNGSQSAEGFLSKIQDDWDDYYQGETGFTLEDWLIEAMTNLEEDNTQIDVNPGSNSAFGPFLLGGYLRGKYDNIIRIHFNHRTLGSIQIDEDPHHAYGNHKIVRTSIPLGEI